MIEKYMQLERLDLVSGGGGGSLRTILEPVSTYLLGIPIRIDRYVMYGD